MTKKVVTKFSKEKCQSITAKYPFKNIVFSVNSIARTSPYKFDLGCNVNAAVQYFNNVVSHPPRTPSRTKKYNKRSLWTGRDHLFPGALRGFRRTNKLTETPIFPTKIHVRLRIASANVQYATARASNRNVACVHRTDTGGTCRRTTNASAIREPETPVDCDCSARYVQTHRQHHAGKQGIAERILTHRVGDIGARQ